MLFLSFCFVLFCLCYFLPGIVALARGHRNAFAIFVLNALLGWTGIGWIVVLIWSLTVTDRECNVIVIANTNSVQSSAPALAVDPGKKLLLPPAFGSSTLARSFISKAAPVKAQKIRVQSPPVDPPKPARVYFSQPEIPRNVI
jgi:hypothetical protein